MKKVFLLLTSAILLFCISCDTGEETDNEKLTVKFENHSSSPYAITGIFILHMGTAGDLPEPTGEFGDNILTSGERIEPANYKMFELSIPNSNFAYCKLAVDKGDGISIRLDEQEGYTNSYEGTITHWGSDERTVTATLDYVKSSDRVIVWWSEWAGIE